jgi:predicted thioredoxin/glutaredoxin
VLLAHRLALASDRVRAAAVEASEFPLSADRHSVYAVPAVVVDGRSGWAGNVPEPVFVQRLLDAAAVH